MSSRSFLTIREVRQPSRYCSKSTRKTLQERITVKLKGKTIGEALDGWERDGKCYPDWRPEVMVACRTMRYEFDESNPVVGADFVSALSLVYDNHADEDPPPGILATKVIDYCKRSDILWPPDFQAHGDRLRAIREAKNLSQGDIEKQSGLKRAYVSRVEHGHTVPSVETLEFPAAELSRAGALTPGGSKAMVLARNGAPELEGANLRYRGFDSDDVVLFDAGSDTSAFGTIFHFLF